MQQQSLWQVPFEQFADGPSLKLGYLRNIYKTPAGSCCLPPTSAGLLGTCDHSSTSKPSSSQPRAPQYHIPHSFSFI